jgi:hypothetical protein
MIALKVLTVSRISDLGLKDGEGCASALIESPNRVSSWVPKVSRRWRRLPVKDFDTPKISCDSDEYRHFQCSTQVNIYYDDLVLDYTNRKRTLEPVHLTVGVCWGLKRILKRTSI